MTSYPVTKLLQRYVFIVFLVMSGFVEYPFIKPILTPAGPSKGSPFVFALFGLPFLALIWGVYFLIVRRATQRFERVRADFRALTPDDQRRRYNRAMITLWVLALPLLAVIAVSLLTWIGII